MSKPIVGVQTYTLREQMKTIPAIAKTLARVRDIGYTSVQLSGCWPQDADELATVLKDTGLTAASTHVGWGDFTRDLDTLIENHRAWGCLHPAIGGLPQDYFCKEGVRKFLNELTPIANRLAEAGMDFSYHNHNHELVRYGQRTWLARLFEDGSPEVVKAEIDVYWITAGGGDPAAWIRKCAGREPILHVKDMVVTPEREQRFAPIGDGNLNWPAILEAATESGVEYLMVEQDDCYGEDPFDCLKRSYDFLTGMGYR